MRSGWKGTFFSVSVLKRAKSARRGVWLTWSRRSCIHESLVGVNVRVYQGKTFEGGVVLEEQLGYTIGSITPTKLIGRGIHRFNRLAQKKRKADELLRQRKARKQRAAGKKRGSQKKKK